MTIDQDGKITRTPRASNFPFHMPFADEVVSTDSNTAVFFAGAKGKLALYEVSLVTTTATTRSPAPVTTTTAPVTIANVCICPNGTPKHGTACTSNGASKCVSCDPGYTINAQEPGCSQNVCIRPNGTPKTGAACTSNGAS